MIGWYSGFILYHRYDESLRGLGKMTGKEEGVEGRMKKEGRGKQEGRRKEEERKKKGIKRE